MKRAARKVFEESSSLFPIGSPVCTDYCSWQDFNAKKNGWPDGEVERRMLASDVHLPPTFQMKGGKYFLHENPAGAKSWSRAPMVDLMGDEMAERIVGDQCQYGQESFR